MSGETEPEPGTEEETPNEENQNEDEQPTEGEEKEEPDATEGEGEEPKEEEAGAEDKGESAEQQHELEGKRQRGLTGVQRYKRKVEYLERENEILRQQAMRPGAAPPPPAKPDAEKTPEEKAQEYVRAMAKQVLAEERQEAEQQRTVSEFRRRTAEVRAKRVDYDEVVSRVDIPAGSPLGQALLTSEHVGEILYQLGANLDELARISALPPVAQVREIGRLEAKLAPSVANPPKPKPAMRPPVPPTSVNGSSSSTRNLDDLSLSEYKLAMRSRRR